MIVHKQILRICYCSILFACLLSNSPALSQKNVDVNLLTGAANITIPVTNVQRGDISVPIVFYYSAGGIKVEDYEQQVGLGWRINTEASITRILRGFPDDMQYQGNSSYSVIKGWIKQTDIGTKVENFSIAGGVTSGTCANEVSDYSYMNTNLPDNYDTEPDIFLVNAPGLSCQFVFDKDQNIQVIPFQDVKITKTVDGSTGALLSFTIVNDKGLKYLFDKKADFKTHIDDIITPSTLPAFKRNYIFFRHGVSDAYLQYTGKWYINYIEDTKGNQVQYSYDTIPHGPAPVANEKVQIIKYNPSTSLFEKQPLYTNSTQMTVNRVKSLWVLDNDVWIQVVQFDWDGAYSESKLTSIKLIREGMVVTPAYTIKFNKINDQLAWGRQFLKSLSFGRGVGAPLAQYKFSYDNVDEVANTSYLTGTGKDSITNGQDYWGYYNGQYSNANLYPEIWVYPDNSSVTKFKINQIPGYGGNEVQLAGANRAASTDAVNGTLTEIIHPNGGYTRFYYENNKYYDPDITGEVTGGGIRVSKIVNNDGLNTNDVTYYDYVDGGVTTGRALSIPSFCFAFPNTTSYSTLADRVKNCTYRTFYNASDESADIFYGKVTVRKTYGGKSVYEFNTAGTWKSSSQNEWYEPNVYVTRNYTSTPSPCNNITPTFLENGKYNYPFPENPNYDFERGLLTKITNYNESGNAVSEETYTYGRSHTSSAKIAALKFDDMTGNGRGYGKYDIVSAVTNLLSQKTNKTYTTVSPYTAYTTETENYYYPTSGEHRLPIRIEKTNSDGMLSKSKMKYAKDYTTTGSGDTYEQAIHNLKAANNNVRIEMHQLVTPSGGSEKVIGADLVTFKAFYNPYTTQNMYLPYENYKFVSQAGVTNFSESTISSGNFTKYSSYFKTSTVLTYDYNGILVGVVDNSRINKTVLIDPTFDIKTAEFSNAKPEEIFYNSFDFSSYNYSAGVTSGTGVQPGRSSSGCLGMTTSTSIVKSSLSMASTNSNMIFSCWIKDAASSGTLTINLSAFGLSANYTISFTTGSDWKYYEKIIPKPSQTSVTVTITTNQNLKMDDMLFYPGNAMAKHYSYSNLSYASTGNSNLILTAETGMGGSAKYFDYDDLGRPLFVRDADNNIREMKFYRQVHNWPAFTQPALFWTDPANVNVSTSFIAVSSFPYGTPGVQYTWVWGDGNTETTTTGTKAHTYTSTGSFTATVTVSAPGLTSSTSTNYTVHVN